MMSCDLFIVVDLIKKVLGQNEKIKELAKELHHHKSIIVMGRGFNYATCLEGALVRGREGGRDGLIGYNPLILSSVIRTGCIL